MSENLKEIIEEQKLLLETIDTQIWYLTDEETYGKVNKAHADFLGLNKSDIEYKKLDEFFLEEVAEIFRQANKEVFNKKEKIKTEVWARNGGGEKRLLLITKNPKLNEKGDVEYVVCSAEDITEIKKYQRKLEMTKFSVDKSGLLIFRVTPKGIIKYANETAVIKLGYDKSELIGINVEKILPDKNHIDREKFWQKINDSDSITYQREFITGKGEKLPVEITSQYYKYNGEEYEYVFAKDIINRKEEEKKINRLLYRDILTDLYNRRFMEEEIKRLNTERQLPISIVMADANSLKKINDNLGHDKGDELLIKIADLLKEVVRDEDILARYGGDEFVILLPQTNRKDAKKIVERIMRECQRTKTDDLVVSLAVGLATKSEVNEDIFSVMQKADDRMYQNKIMQGEGREHEVLTSLINLLGAKSGETKEHSMRMKVLAYKLAKSIGLSNSQENKLSLLATLHDIGKISIPDKILEKPDSLTKKERKIVGKHSENGYRIASSTEEFVIVAEDILYHHERWNGNGYPKKIKGEKIPLLARIISIVDAYDVMTNERSYSPAISKEAALKEIERCAGSQFDPELAKRFIEIMR